MISFYTATGEYGFLSNFSPHGFMLDDRFWCTVEHYFQAQKFADSDYEERIRKARTPKQAKALGQTRDRPLRSDWEEIKVEVMRRAVSAKFVANEEICRALLSTGSRQLVEDFPGDYF